MPGLTPTLTPQHQTQKTSSIFTQQKQPWRVLFLTLICLGTLGTTLNSPAFAADEGIAAAEAALDEGDLRRAEGAFEKILGEEKGALIQGRAALGLGNIAGERFDFELSKRRLGEAIQHFGDRNDATSWKGIALYQRAELEMARSDANAAAVKQDLKNALTAFNKQKDKNLRTAMAQWRGNVHMLQGNFALNLGEPASPFFLQAAKAFEEGGDVGRQADAEFLHAHAAWTVGNIKNAKLHFEEARRLYRSDISDKLAIGRCYTALGQIAELQGNTANAYSSFKRAQSSFDTYIRTRSKDAPDRTQEMLRYEVLTQFGWAEAALTLGELEEAALHYKTTETLLSTLHLDWGKRIEMGKLKLRAHKGESKKVVERLAVLCPELSSEGPREQERCNLLHGQLLFDLEEFDASRTLLEGALAAGKTLKDPTLENGALATLAKLLLKNKASAETGEILAKALKILPKNDHEGRAQLFLGLADIAEQKGDWGALSKNLTQAESLYIALDNQGQLGMILLRRSQLELRNGKRGTRKAKKLLQQVEAIAKTHANPTLSARLNLAGAQLLAAQGKEKDAIKSFMLAAPALKSDGMTTLASSAYLDLAKLQLGAKKPNEAFAAAKEAIALLGPKAEGPEARAAFTIQANILFASERPEDARASLNKVLTLAEAASDATVISKSARQIGALDTAAGKHAEAQRMLEKAIAQHPLISDEKIQRKERARTHLLLGFVLKKQGKKKEAYKAFETSRRAFKKVKGGRPLRKKAEREAKALKKELK